MRGFWTCQRTTAGVKCRASNPNRVQKCSRCGKRRPKRERPAHMSALSLSYDYYELLNGGPNCGICGKPPAPGKRHHRDHEHQGVGTPRGLLCWKDNKLLHNFVTVEWLEAALAYLKRVEDRRAA
jgi:hypothetical protein